LGEIHSSGTIGLSAERSQGSDQKEINTTYGSTFVEEKSYQQY